MAKTKSSTGGKPAKQSNKPSNPTQPIDSAVVSNTAMVDKSSHRNQNTTVAAATQPPTELQPEQMIVICKFDIVLPDMSHTIPYECTSENTIYDIRQYLYDVVGTCHITNYHFETDGIDNNDRIQLNDFVELSQYPVLCNNGVSNVNQSINDITAHKLYVVYDMYDERTAKLHIKRIREIILNPPVTTIESDNTTNDTKSDTSLLESRQIELDGSVDDAVQITDLLTDKQYKAMELHEQLQSIQCIYSIQLSLYNPPGTQAKLRGDLLYLTVHTLENIEYHITVRSNGFHVNQTESNNHMITKFNPLPRTDDTKYSAHSLHTLLCQLSVLYKTKYQQKCKLNTVENTLESSRITIDHIAAIDSSNWLSYHQSTLVHSNIGVVEDTTIDITQSGRDYNEEYQTALETTQTKNNPSNDILLHDKLVYTTYKEFIDTSIHAVQLILSGLLPPINPLENAVQHVYVYNSIFFSYAHTLQQLHEYKQQQVNNDADGKSIDNDDIESISYDKINADINSIAQINLFPGASELHTIATCIVRQSGHRIIAQTIIPGILYERVNKHIFGTLNKDQQFISNNELFNSRVQTISNILHIDSHTIVDKSAARHIIELGYETKGIDGADGRSYLLDLFRTTPVDTYWLQNHAEHNELEKQYILRHTLVSAYCHQQAKNAVIHNVDSSKQLDNNSTADAVNQQIEHNQQIYDNKFNSIRFDVDLYTKHSVDTGDDRYVSIGL